MAVALRLAAKGRGLTSPNPIVGAVVVAGGRIVGRGYHRRAGGPHAEVVALRQAGTLARSATLYVTLEPCRHTTKRTPPCLPAIVASGLRRVVVAMPDPNPRVDGHGIRGLRRHGLTVDVGCLRAQAECLNESYCHWVRTGRPFVLLKAAMSLDGKLAAAGGESRWITGEEARREVHRLRSRVDAIMVGIGTVLRDDPRLTARPGERRAGRRPGVERRPLAARQPLRVILDSTLRIPLRAKVLARPTKDRAGRHARLNTLIATTSRASKRGLERLRSLGVPVVVLPVQSGRPSLRACLTRLGRMGITSVMIEGGGELNAAALRGGLVNRVRFYVAPLLLGGQDATSVIGGSSPRTLTGAWRLEAMQTRRVGRDVVIEGTVQTNRRNKSGRGIT